MNPREHGSHPQREFDVLLVEDNPADARLVQELLKEVSSFRVDQVSRLRDAREYLDSEGPDVLVVDLSLPDSQGLETLDRLHRHAPSIPMVVLTGHDDEAMAQQAVRRGAQDYLIKGQLDGASLSRSLTYAVVRHRLIQDRDNAIRTARASAKTFFELVANIADAVVVFDEQGIIRYLNPTAESLYGRSSEALLGQKFDLDQTSGPTELEILRPDESKRIAEARVVNIVWQGQPARLASLRDITDAKQTAELERRLIHADRLAAIGQLAAGIAHEINNPAAFLVATLSLLQERLQSLQRSSEASDDGFISLQNPDLRFLRGEALTAVGDGIDALSRIREIIRGVQLFSRVGEREIEWVDMKRATEAAARLTHNEIRHRARLVTQLEQTPLIAGHAGRLTQVMINLLVNAAHAIEDAPTPPPDGHTISLTLKNEADTIVFMVEDSGPGVPEGQRERIFEPFFTSKGPERGTGLGLALCRDIVHFHAGTIKILDATAGGACFKLTIPKDTGLKVDQQPPINHKPASKPGRARVLIIDDEPLLRRTYSMMLRGTCDVVTTDSGAAALETLKNDPNFDAIICDVMMPDMDGRVVYDSIGEFAAQLQERIIFCTGGVFIDSLASFLSSIDNRVLEKPMTPTQLRKAISDLVDRS